MFGIEDFSQKIVDFSNFDIADLGRAAVFGGAILLIGMATIFAVLCIIWLCLILFKVVFHDLAVKKSSAPKSEAQAPVEPQVVATDDNEIIAVIAAAIAMAESESTGAKFRVVSFKRK